jgi:hypothetical protein
MSSMWRWLVEWWPNRQRSIDLDILWPTCKEQALDLDHARAAFAVHAFHDPAWLRLGHDEIVRRVGELT